MVRQCARNVDRLHRRYRAEAELQRRTLIIMRRVEQLGHNFKIKATMKITEKQTNSIL